MKDGNPLSCFFDHCLGGLYRTMTNTPSLWRLKVDYPALAAEVAGKNLQQDPKYVGYAGLMYNRLTGTAIPPWEPIFLFRAKDDLAVEALTHYEQQLQRRYEALRVKYGPLAAQTRAAAQHLWAVSKRVADFVRFSIEHQASMKAPDTTPSLNSAGLMSEMSAEV